MAVPKYGVAFDFDVQLVDASNRDAFKSSPTLAAGDVQVSKDGGAFANLATLPSAAPAASENIKVALDATEMQCGRFTVRFKDQTSPQEWLPLFVSMNVPTNNVQDAYDKAVAVEVDTQDIQARVPAALVGGRMAANAEVVGDKSGYALSSAGVQAIWDALTSALTTAGSIGKHLVDRIVGTLATGTHNPQSGDAFARLGAPAGASVSADVAAVKTDTGNLVTRITSTLFSGITSLAQWLGLLAGKQAGNATARTELRATGAGAGTFDETTDSQEAIRDATLNADVKRVNGVVIEGSGTDVAPWKAQGT